MLQNRFKEVLIYFDFTYHVDYGPQKVISGEVS